MKRILLAFCLLASMAQAQQYVTVTSGIPRKASIGRLQDLGDPLTGTLNMNGFALNNLSSDSKFTNTAWYVGNMLASNAFYTFTSNNSAAQINAVIDGIPKNLNGFTATIQLGPGTWTNWRGTVTSAWFTTGTFYIRGDTPASGPRVNQTTIIVATNQQADVFAVNSCYSFVLSDMQIRFNSTNSRVAVNMQRCQSYNIGANYFKGNGTVSGNGVQVAYCGIAPVQYNVFDNCSSAIYVSWGGGVFSLGNIVTNTPPAYGYNNTGGIILCSDTNWLGTTFAIVANGGVTVTNTAGKLF